MLSGVCCLPFIPHFLRQTKIAKRLISLSICLHLGSQLCSKCLPCRHALHVKLFSPCLRYTEHVSVTQILQTCSCNSAFLMRIACNPLWTSIEGSVCMHVYNFVQHISPSCHIQHSIRVMIEVKCCILSTCHWSTVM